MTTQKMNRPKTIVFAIILLLFAVGCKSPTQQEARKQTTNSQEKIDRKTYDTRKVKDVLKQLDILYDESYGDDDSDKDRELSTALKKVSDLFIQKEAFIRENEGDDFINQLEVIRASLASGNVESALSELNIAQEDLENISSPSLENQIVDALEELSEAKKDIQRLEKSANQIDLGFIKIPYPLSLAQGGSLVGFVSSIAAFASLSRVKKQRIKVEELMSQTREITKSVNGIILDIETVVKPSYKDNRIVIDKLDKSVKKASSAIEDLTFSKRSVQLEQLATPVAPRLVPPEPLGPNKELLVSALNNGDRKQLKELATSQLNITDESENNIAIGKLLPTELEAVLAGGSYQLIIITDQSWLFPTELTLRGFTAAEKSKGIFDYEEQSISSPQLLEPALLEGSGNHWRIKRKGIICLPR